MKKQTEWCVTPSKKMIFKHFAVALDTGDVRSENAAPATQLSSDPPFAMATSTLRWARHSGHQWTPGEQLQRALVLAALPQMRFVWLHSVFVSTSFVELRASNARFLGITFNSQLPSFCVLQVLSFDQ